MTRGSNDDRTATASYVAAIRFGLGVGVNDLAAMDARPRDWLKAQTEGPAEGAVARSDDEEWLEAQERIRKYAEALEGVAHRKRKAKSPAARQQVASISRRLKDRYFREGFNRYLSSYQSQTRRIVTTPEPFKERLVRFWVNHFAVVAQNKAMLMTLPALENQAIRPFVTGKFRDMLLAVESHPAMIEFLDNTKSIGPNSPDGRRRRKGLNENLAREILELHTLGVDGGYSQDDVGSFAKILTGWTLVEDEDASTYGDFQFKKSHHEPGTHTVLGKAYADTGVEQGRALLGDLAVHPSTARFLSVKLAQHFISDAPAEDDVRYLADAYLSSDGDLGEVYRALIDLDAPWKTPLTKIKQPWDYAASCLRVLDLELNEKESRLMFNQLRGMGQPPHRPPGPQGWYDRWDDWADSSSLLNRVGWAGYAARWKGSGLDASDVAMRALGPLLGDQTRHLIETTADRSDQIALLLASPEFQRR